MTNSWMNEDGEPIMDGAAWRFEQQLDMDAQQDFMADHFYDDYDEDDELSEDDAYDMAEDAAMESGLWGSET